MNWKTSVAILIAAVALAGCDKASQDQVTDKSDQAKQTIQKGAANSKVAADSDLETLKVTGALKAAAGLNTTDIRVDTDSVAKTITLSGDVPTKEQHTQAVKVTQGIAGTEFKVDDKLTVKKAEAEPAATGSKK